jgi:fatty acid desaturase
MPTQYEIDDAEVEYQREHREKEASERYWERYEKLHPSPPRKPIPPPSGFGSLIKTILSIALVIVILVAAFTWGGWLGLVIAVLVILLALGGV